MKIKLLITSLLLACATAFPLDGLYLGAQLGHVALTGKASPLYSNTIGFAVDLGFRTNAILDVLFSSQYSSHMGGGNGVSVYAETIGANFHVLEANDFDLSLGGGPGFYFFKYALKTETIFGLNTSANIDVKVTEHVRIGLGLRYHIVFTKDQDIGDNLWTVMMRMGYLFGE